MQKDNMLADAFAKVKEFEIENNVLTKKIGGLELTMQQDREKVKSKLHQEMEALRKENETLKHQIKAK
jgi:chaperonin cofactor prefoldin